MKEIKRGTEVYIKVTITGRASDNRPEEEKGYKFQTRRGGNYVDPADILVPLLELE